MKKHISNIIIFSLIIFSFMLWWIIKDKEEYVLSERRKATPLPKINTILSEEYSQNFDKAMSDTFPLRDKFRTLLTTLRLDVMHLSDVNGYYKADGHIMKMEEKLNEEQIMAGADKTNTLSEKHLKNSKIYYSVIPDKNYYLAEKNGYPHIDYEKLLSIFKDNVKAGEYIDIFPSLTIDSFYKTDSHWSQDKILPVAEKILFEMGNTPHKTEYTEKKIDNFKGVYSAHSGISISAETMVYLESEKIKKMTVSSIEKEGTSSVYLPENFSSADPYNLYLDGACALITMEREKEENEKDNHLIIFRDSFGSSIAPLFAENYTKITLIDLRYIASSQLENYVDFNGADVLFLYNTSIINNAYLLR